MRMFGGFSVFMKKKSYRKEPKTFQEQLELLRERGLEIPNEEKAKRILQNISYNRLSSYWYPLLEEPKEEETFKKGVSFETAFRLYQFDSELRLLTFYAIEQIEVAIRTQIIYHQSHKYNSGFWYEKPDAFQSYPQYAAFLNKICDSVKSTKEEFIKKYGRKYLEFIPPAWKSFEIISFTALYSTYKNLRASEDKNRISDHFKLNYNVFISWMDTLVYIRNICAHHSRLWNIKLTRSPVWLKSPRSAWVSRWENEDKNLFTKDKQLKSYAVFCIIAYLLNNVNPYHQFKRKLKELISSFPEVDIAHMGFTDYWLEEDLWK